MRTTLNKPVQSFHLEKLWPQRSKRWRAKYHNSTRRFPKFLLLGCACCCLWASLEIPVRGDSASPHTATRLYCLLVRKDPISKSWCTMSWNCFFLLSPIYNSCFLPLPFPPQGTGHRIFTLWEWSCLEAPGSGHLTFELTHGQGFLFPTALLHAWQLSTVDLWGFWCSVGVL